MKSIFKLAFAALLLVGMTAQLSAQTNYVFDSTGGTGGNWTDAGSWSPSYPGVAIAAGNTLTISSGMLLNVDVEISCDATINPAAGTGGVSVLNGRKYIQRAGTMSMDAGLWTGDIFSDAGSKIIVNSQWRFGTQGNVIDGDIEVNDLAFAFNNNRSATFNGELSGTGTALGASSTTPIHVNGTISPGSGGIGCLNVSVFDTNNATETNIEINGTTACTEHDRITTNNGGTYNPNGTLNFIVGYTPTDGDVITFVDATNASVVGTYATVNAPSGWAIAYNAPNAGEITMTFDESTVVAPVPTMGEWALITFGLIIMSMGVITVRRREQDLIVKAA